MATKKTTGAAVAASENAIVLNFEYEKSTPGTHRFKEVTTNGAAPVVGTLYVRKSAMPTAPANLVMALGEV